MENIFREKKSFFDKRTINKEIKNINKKMTRKDMLKNIIQEYESKQKSFNPNKPSPNKFIKNLEIRMRMYYKDLYK
jgi:hypothetical protein